jgi:nucleoid-associated protein YgaU
MQVSGPVCGPSCDWRRSIVCGFVLFSFLAIQARGQDAAEAARQERARKAEEHKASRHVYTEEDLKQKKILAPEDQARAEVRKQQQNAATGEQNAKQAPQAPNDANPQNESLGEIAHRYRQEKAAHEAERAAWKKFAPFLHAMPDSTLAEPNPGPAPITGVGAEVIGRPVVPVHKPALRPLLPPGGSSAHGRISPFQPRPLVGGSAAVPPPLAVVPDLAVLPVAPERPTEKGVPSTFVIQRMKRLEVQRGQSWWKLAQVYLGNGARWRELRALNPDTDGPRELLKLGSTVLVPENEKASENSSSGTVTVEKGASLWSLARKYLGRGSAWSCLASANPNIADYTHLAIGTTVLLPQDDALQTCRDLGGVKR